MIENELISVLSDNWTLSYNIWERFSANELVEEITSYQMFWSLVLSLQSAKANIAVKSFQKYFLADADYEEKTASDTNSAEFLAAKDLVPGKKARTSKLSFSFLCAGWSFSM